MEEIKNRFGKGVMIHVYKIAEVKFFARFHTKGCPTIGAGA